MANVSHSTKWKCYNHAENSHLGSGNTVVSVQLADWWVFNSSEIFCIKSKECWSSMLKNYPVHGIFIQYNRCLLLDRKTVNTKSIHSLRACMRACETRNLFLYLLFFFPRLSKQRARKQRIQIFPRSNTTELSFIGIGIFAPAGFQLPISLPFVQIICNALVLCTG